MGRLTTLGSRLSRLPGGRLKLAETRQQVDRNRNAQAWRGWYGLKRWKQLRWSVLVRDGFTCQREGCGRIEHDTSKLVADHRTPHRGDPALFWSERNLLTLCAACHSGAKQAEELAAGL
jgi:5-methylcytosine-specific restriction enzyme A